MICREKVLKTILLIAFLFCAQSQAYALLQGKKIKSDSSSKASIANTKTYDYSNTGDFKEKKFFYAASLMFNYGKIYDMIDFAPSIGYYLRPNIIIGIGGTASYNSYKDARPHARFDSQLSILGGFGFVRYYFDIEKAPFFDDIYLLAEYEINSVVYESFNGDPKVKNKKTKLNDVNHLPKIGFGYQREIFDGVNLEIDISFVFLGQAYSPYKNPLIGLGINF